MGAETASIFFLRLVNAKGIGGERGLSMDEKQILNKLNWFYSLELNQVGLYKAQSKYVEDIYVRKVLERAVDIEQQHVDNIAAQIRARDGEPTSLGDVIAPLMGKTSGNIVSWLGLVPALKANIMLEQKAMSDYKDFILQIGEDYELFNLLWSHLIDEDFHTSWFHSKVQEIEDSIK